ncbi:helix-turn-helix domain-containing protein [Ornithinibacillus halotolerans]|uniref:Transcriptional regulator n=2 Tax=Ornithinibacillus halotolerans TaxID=1274357 RepID=A0A916SBG3_9BACI|nr:helix-turn-helix domain-containing protein [Ornithinibacillus halotolerans]GGA92912.1 transcriptional regulator [Ornithinibacillus halotolerans]
MEKVGFGNLIRVKRLEKNLSQENLSFGICSPSYLSRIENGQVLVEDDIYVLLFERLGLDYYQIATQSDDNLEQIENWYESLIANCESNMDIERIKDHAITAGGDLYLKYQIVYSYYLLRNKNFEQAAVILNKIEEHIQPGYNRNYFLYVYVYMFYSFIIKQYKDAIREGLNLLAVKDFGSLAKPIELGEFYYLLAYNYIKTYSYERSTHYANQALSIFNDNYILMKTAKCHILLGISYNNTGFYEESIEAYHRVKSLLKYLPEQDQIYYLSMVYNNIGYCYELQHNYHHAIAYYKKGLEFNDTTEKARTYVNLIRCYYILKDYATAMRYLQETNNLTTETPSQEQEIQLSVFTVLLQENTWMEDLIEIEKVSMEFFSNNRLLNLTYDYALIFADQYEKHSDYKRANTMYKLAIHTKEQISMRG